MKNTLLITLFTFICQASFSQDNFNSNDTTNILLISNVLSRAKRIKLVETDTIIVWSSYDLLVKSLRNQIKAWDVEEDKILLNKLLTAESLESRFKKINSTQVLKSRLEFRTIHLLQEGRCVVYNKILKQDETNIIRVEYWKKWWTGIKFLTSQNTFIIDVRTGEF